MVEYSIVKHRPKKREKEDDEQDICYAPYGVRKGGRW